MTQDLIQAFRLGDNAERCAILDALLPELNSYEWRALKQRLDARRFHFDIVGALPIELVIKIFSFLDPAAPFLYRRVSKKWHSTLSSSQLCESSLRQWYSANDPPLVGEEPGMDEREIHFLKLEQMQRFRLGIPSSSAFLRLGSPANAFDFFGEQIAWRTKHCEIIVLNLRNNDILHHTTPGREMIKDFYLMTRFLTLTTWTGRCYAIDLSTHESRMCRTPNASAELYRGDGGIVPIKINEDGVEKFMIWNLDTVKTKLLSIQKCQCHPSVATNSNTSNDQFSTMGDAWLTYPIVNSAKGQVTLMRFRQECGGHGDTVLAHHLGTRHTFNLAGDCIHHDQIRNWGDRAETQAIRMAFRKTFPTDYNNRICYGTYMYRLHVGFLTVSDRELRSIERLHDSQIHLTLMSLWKSVSICLTNDQVTLREDGPEVRYLPPATVDTTWCGSRLELLGNEHFVVLCYERAISIWSFNPNLDVRDLQSAAGLFRPYDDLSRMDDTAKSYE